MNKFKGTPSPWEKDGVEIRGVTQHPSECILVMTPGYEREDALLIAAAPELLEALQELLHGTFPDGVGDDGSGRTGFNKEAIARYKKAELAIAKALGK